jgi:hypothetical protein
MKIDPHHHGTKTHAEKNIGKKFPYHGKKKAP